MAEKPSEPPQVLRGCCQQHFVLDAAVRHVTVDALRELGYTDIQAASPPRSSPAAAASS
jgi:hypothetical protein